jgi:hypothetical protein
MQNGRAHFGQAIGNSPRSDGCVDGVGVLVRLSGGGTEMSGLLLLPGALPWILVVGGIAQVIVGAPIILLD